MVARVLKHYITLNYYHHTVQVAQAQVWCLHQWKEKTPPAQIAMGKITMCASGDCANSRGRNSTTVSCCWWQPPQAQGAKVRVQGAKVRSSISASRKGMQQQHATPTTTTTDQLRISTGAGGVHDAAIIATCRISGTTAGAAHFSMYEYSTHTHPPIARQQRPHPITDMSLRKEGHIRGGSLKSSMAPSLQLCCPQVVGGAHLLQWHSRLLVNQPSIGKACAAIQPDIGVHSLQDHVLTTHFHNHVPERSSSILSEPPSGHDRQNNQPLDLITSEASCHIDTVILYYIHVMSKPQLLRLCKCGVAFALAIIVILCMYI